jgi:DNA-binding response OmpR family regulator
MSIPEGTVRLSARITVDLRRCLLMRDGESIDLTAREIKLLAILLEKPGYYVSTEVLARQLMTVAGYDTSHDPAHCVAQTMTTLRFKLDEKPYHPAILRNRRGVGYAIVIEPEPLPEQPH